MVHIIFCMRDEVCITTMVFGGRKHPFLNLKDPRLDTSRFLHRSKSHRGAMVDSLGTCFSLEHKSSLGRPVSAVWHLG